MLKVIIAVSLCFSLSGVQAQGIERWKIGDVVKYLKDSSGPEIKVINVWATFCKPCVAEIPGFIETVKSFKGKASLMLISVDMESKYPMGIATFAQIHQFTAPIKWLDETDADYFCPKLYPTWSGSIPATLIMNMRTGYRKFFEDEMDAADLKNEIQIALKSKKE